MRKIDQVEQDQRQPPFRSLPASMSRPIDHPGPSMSLTVSLPVRVRPRIVVQRPPRSIARVSSFSNRYASRRRAHGPTLTSPTARPSADRRRVPSTRCSAAQPIRSTRLLDADQVRSRPSWASRTAPLAASPLVDSQQALRGPRHRPARHVAVTGRARRAARREGWSAPRGTVGSRSAARSPAMKMSGWPGTDRSGSTRTRPARSSGAPSSLNNWG